jgi:hypothetical protein
VLAVCASLRATRTLERRNPRMVKRRHSPYACFDRHARRRVPIDCWPSLLEPLSTHPRQRFPRPVEI